jgi:hypothetical protein
VEHVYDVEQRWGFAGRLLVDNMWGSRREKREERGERRGGLRSARKRAMNAVRGNVVHTQVENRGNSLRKRTHSSPSWTT